VSTTDSDADSPSSGNDDLTPAQYRDLVEKLRKENAKQRVDAKEFAALRAEKEQQNAAKLTIEEKLAAEQAKRAELETQMQERVVRADIRIAASSMGLKPELAYRLLDYSQVEFDERGDPTNVTDLLVKAAQEFGLSVTTPGASNGKSNGARAQQQSQQPSGIGATTANPARSTGNVPAGGWSEQAIAAMTPEKYAAMSDAERASLSQWQQAHPYRR
jgi:hypothetical protein